MSYADSLALLKTIESYKYINGIRKGIDLLSQDGEGWVRSG